MIETVRKWMSEFALGEAGAEIAAQAETLVEVGAVAPSIATAAAVGIALATLLSRRLSIFVATSVLGIVGLWSLGLSILPNKPPLPAAPLVSALSFSAEAALVIGSFFMRRKARRHAAEVARLKAVNADLQQKLDDEVRWRTAAEDYDREQEAVASS